MTRTPPPRAIRIGVIGAGARATYAYIAYLKAWDTPVQLAAIADVSADNAAICKRAAGDLGRQANVYSDWRDLLASEPMLDGMVVTTPNHLHHEVVVACMHRGVKAIALEKPLAITPAQCRDIVQCARRYDAKVLLGFVLRSTPFYTTIKRLLDEHAVGRIISVQADELVNVSTTSIMMRGSWRRLAQFSGGSLLEKCCHDLDLITWLVNARPTRLSSFGSRRIFVPRDDLVGPCGECDIKETCVYSRAATYEQDATERAMNDYIRDSDACIYAMDGDLADHQSVQIAYDNGVVAHFMLNFNAQGPRSHRNLHIVGDRGRIWGNLADPVVWHHDNEADKTREIPLALDESGHGGGDKTHAFSFFRCITEPDYHPHAGVYDGYLSAMMAFAADRSKDQQRQVGIRVGDDLIEIE